MSESKTVRLDKDVIETLADKREGFETPNECLKRLLDQNPCSSENKTMSEVEEDDS
jgi:hypothetical protein